MPTDTFNYLEESARTASGEFHGEFVNLTRFIDCLEDFKLAAEKLDRYKKLMFYGEDVNKGRLRDTKALFDGYNIVTDIAIVDIENREKYQYILHALLGVMTEAGEMAEALHKALELDRAGIDLINLLEESGDIKWYLAMLARALGNEWDADERRNIDKLRQRFPEKFTEIQANDRDLESERKILENYSK